ncbi:MAG: CCA tRNA nucleotidyltransferase [Roseovarius sp.]
MKITGDWINSEATQAVCRMLTDTGHQALFVGGCVRNPLLGAPVKDIDIATDARPDAVMTLAKTAGLKAIPTGMDHGTVTVVSGNAPYEITTFRNDVETFGRHAVVAFADDVIEDARRRDFTMNALYAQPDGTVIDPLGGLADLHARRFRFIEDAAQRIQEDYLRTLRFFRFNAWYGDPSAGLDDEALAAIAAHLDGLSTLSRERVGSEMLKLLSAPDPCFAVAAMRQCGVLHAVLPGADDRALGPLVHLEGEMGIEPVALRRLSVLGGDTVPKRLRLSRTDAKSLDQLQQMTGDMMSALELGYRHGAILALDVLLVRAAVMGGVVDKAALVQVERGSGAEFPLKAADLQHAFQGPALGRALKEAEQHWLDADLSPDRNALLRHVDKP